MIIEYVPIEQLKFADYNPRNITEKQVEDLKASIEKFGVVEPVVVNKNPERKDIIVGGHQRTRILQLLGFKTVPVVYVDLDEAKERELNIRLNKNTGEWDWNKLANEFDVEDLKEYGFTDGELGIGDTGKESIDTDNLGNALDSYLDGNIRQVVLYFKKEEYEAILPRIEAVMQSEKVESHTEAFIKMLETYENSRTQKQGA